MWVFVRDMHNQGKIESFSSYLGGGGDDNDAGDPSSDNDYVNDNDLANEPPKKKAKRSNGSHAARVRCNSERHSTMRSANETSWEEDLQTVQQFQTMADKETFEYVRYDDG